MFLPVSAKMPSNKGNLQCSTLASVLPGLVAYPNSTEYATSNTYWSSRQSELTPNCFVTPKCAEDVSTALTTLIEAGSPFTVKAGGHTAFGGGSSIDDGVTIDLIHLNDVVVNGRESVSLGPAARWGNVSSVLDPLGLAVVGGRVGDVGVAGLILGGGISYFSGRRGWACDNVLKFEVVVPSGDILTASPDEESELYWALRGGGGASFGIVTNFEIETFDQGDLWSNAQILTPEVYSQELLPILPAFVNNELEQDPDAHMFVVYTDNAQLGGYVAFVSSYHVKPSESDPEEVPEAFEPLQQLESVSSTVTVDSVGAISGALAEPYGVRATWWDTSIKITRAAGLLDYFREVFETFVARVKVHGEFTPFLVYQPLTQSTMRAMQRNGGNALGLQPDVHGALVIIQVSARWTDPALDAVVEEQWKRAMREIETISFDSEMLHWGFKYMNYASRQQDVFATYGLESMARLKAVAETYDPEAVLPELWNGYFQIQR